MLKRSLLAAALVVAFSTPAFAFYCPLNGKAIGEADMSRLSAAEQSNVTALRDGAWRCTIPATTRVP